MSTFVKVMQKKLWPLFFRTRCRISLNNYRIKKTYSVFVFFSLFCQIVEKKHRARTDREV